MPVTAFAERYPGLAAAAVVTVAVLGLAILIPASGIRPYGEQVLLERMNNEDSIVCEKFGFTGGTLQSTDCVLALARLRKRQIEFLMSQSWL